MNFYLVSFTTSAEDIGYMDLELRRDRLHKSTIPYGMNAHFRWDRSQLKRTAFYKENREVLDGKKGAGYFLWKPFIILDALEKINEGEILIYADNAVYFIASPEEEIKQCIENKGFFLIQAYGHLCAQYVKRDAFHYMQQDTPEYHHAHMVQASFLIFQKNNTTVSFVKEWLHYCKNKHIVTDWENVCGKENLAGFKNHLFDMSVLSLLVAKHHIETFIPIHDILKRTHFEQFDKATIASLKKQHPQRDITYVYSNVIIWDRDNYGHDIASKIKRLLNPQKAFFILYRKFLTLVK